MSGRTYPAYALDDVFRKTYKHQLNRFEPKMTQSDTTRSRKSSTATFDQQSSVGRNMGCFSAVQTSQHDWQKDNLAEVTVEG